MLVKSSFVNFQRGRIASDRFIIGKKITRLLATELDRGIEFYFNSQRGAKSRAVAQCRFVHVVHSVIGKEIFVIDCSTQWSVRSASPDPATHVEHLIALSSFVCCPPTDIPL